MTEPIGESTATTDADMGRGTFGRTRGHGSTRAELPSLGPGKGAQTTRGLRRRSLILKVAANLFAERGFDGVTINEIGFESGVTGPAIYRYFASKEELLVSIYEHLYRRFRDGLNEIMSAGCQGAEAISGFIDLQIDLAAQEAEKIRIVELEWRHLPQKESELLRAENRSHLAVWRELLHEVRPDLTAAGVETTLHALLSLINSISLKRGPESVTAADRQRLREMALSVVHHSGRLPVDSEIVPPARKARPKVKAKIVRA